ncbi:MAG: substrate-binding domain-containing protein [Clostridiales bacterium]|jgi:ABC-type sugar transport system substrate-binding protein|nr:substrate-binding domain-containing protein [Clostridiales bacterium]
MKKLCIAALLLSFVLASCGVSGDVEQKTRQSRQIERAAAEPTRSVRESLKKIGVLALTGSNQTQSYAEARLATLENDQRALGKFLNAASALEMVGKINELLEWKADAIVCMSAWSGMEDQVSALVEQGVPVVIYKMDASVEGARSIGLDVGETGRIAAEYLAEKTEGKGVVAIFKDMDEKVGRGEDVFCKKITELAPNIRIVQLGESYWSNGGVSKALAANHTLDAVFSMNENCLVEVCQAIKDSGRTDIKAIAGAGYSQGYFKLIKANPWLWIGGVAQMPQAASEAVDYALRLANSEVGDPVVVQGIMVDKDNYKEFLEREGQ